jgi:hypothetical protein
VNAHRTAIIHDGGPVAVTRRSHVAASEEALIDAQLALDRACVALSRGNTPHTLGITRNLRRYVRIITEIVSKQAA